VDGDYDIKVGGSGCLYLLSMQLLYYVVVVGSFLLYFTYVKHRAHID